MKWSTGFTFSDHPGRTKTDAVSASIDWKFVPEFEYPRWRSGERLRLRNTIAAQAGVRVRL